MIGKENYWLITSFIKLQKYEPHFLTQWEGLGATRTRTMKRRMRTRTRTKKRARTKRLNCIVYSVYTSVLSVGG